MARHYYHEIIHVNGKENDICGNVRKGLDITNATNYNQSYSISPPNIIKEQRARSPQRSTGITGRKRSSSNMGAPLPPSKHNYSTSSVKTKINTAVPNRVHRRIIVSNYGKAIYTSSTPAILLAALKGYINGYESLHKRAGILQRDISPNNLIINEENNGSWPAFLINLDLAIKKQRVGFSGARGKTGTRAFMAIGVLRDKKHSFIHDLESFFWVPTFLDIYSL